MLIKLPPLLAAVHRRASGRPSPVRADRIAGHGASRHFFPSLELRGAVLFRVIRNSELSIDRDEVEDLRDSVEAELRRRERKQVVCLEIDDRAADELVRVLTDGTRARDEDVYRVPGS